MHAKFRQNRSSGSGEIGTKQTHRQSFLLLGLGFDRKMMQLQIATSGLISKCKILDFNRRFLRDFFSRFFFAIFIVDFRHFFSRLFFDFFFMNFFRLEKFRHRVAKI